MDVTEIASLDQLFERVRRLPAAQTLLLLDVDQTLLRSPWHWGSEAWYEWLIAQGKARGLTEADATLQANARWEEVGHLIAHVPMETHAVDALADWQRAGFAMGLTARDRRFAARTREHLSVAGYRLTGAQGAPARIDFGDLGLYEQGVLYVGPLGDKGAALEAFLARLSTLPLHALFVDDKSHHVVNVEKVLRARGIDCFAARYRGSDALTRSFDPQAAKEEEARFRTRSANPSDNSRTKD